MAFADSRIFISVVAVGALAGACAEQLLFIRLIPSAADLPWALWLKYALADIRFEGAIAGALLVNLGWMIRNPRMRMRRSVVAAIAANAAAWIAFLIAVPPLTPSDFALIDAERTRRDAESSGRLMHHEPIIVGATAYPLLSGQQHGPASRDLCRPRHSMDREPHSPDQIWPRAGHAT